MMINIEQGLQKYECNKTELGKQRLKFHCVLKIFILGKPLLLIKHHIY